MKRNPVMNVQLSEMSSSFLVLPNEGWRFGEASNFDGALRIVERMKFHEIADVLFTSSGAIGIRFLRDGPLASINRMNVRGNGIIPDEVRLNHETTAEIHSKRTTFANFIAAAVSGRLCAASHSSLSGARYIGMDRTIFCNVTEDRLIPHPTEFALTSIQSHLAFGRPQQVQREQLSGVCQFLEALVPRQTELSYASIEACMTMNYQGAILHNEQHSAASLALNFSVAEALIHEIFLVYGLVDGSTPCTFATRTHSVEKRSQSAFEKQRLFDRANTLKDGKLLHHYVWERLDECRQARNRLMHDASSVSHKLSGSMLTVVRDLWSYVLDGPFELNSSVSIRFG